MKINKKQI